MRASSMSNFAFIGTVRRKCLTVPLFGQSGNPPSGSTGWVRTMFVAFIFGAESRLYQSSYPSRANQK